MQQAAQQATRTASKKGPATAPAPATASAAATAAAAAARAAGCATVASLPPDAMTQAASQAFRMPADSGGYTEPQGLGAVPRPATQLASASQQLGAADSHLAAHAGDASAPPRAPQPPYTGPMKSSKISQISITTAPAVERSTEAPQRHGRSAEAPPAAPAAPAATAPVAPVAAAAAGDGWHARSKKDTCGAPPATDAPVVPMRAPPAPTPLPEAAAAAAAAAATAAAGLAPGLAPMALPPPRRPPPPPLLEGGWRVRPNAVVADGDNAPMPSASDSIPTSAIPATECRPFGGKRFRKAQTRSSNEIVSLKMEKVVTNLDVNGAEKAGEAPENNDELFEQSLEQGRGPRGTKQQRRR